ncbi:uncharacterized protein LOC124145773 isoform X2 [Haliotis rufescens]|uniref:uncharacterized protein LOC124145773 isoform X2 n=1 Tax=Haliotis rufescens TaxID=6454 RepID=UPI001EAFF8DA|nr:uncharacterized protein LOC124145773 isoform X2 [Haliotis rufescens]
MDTTCVMCELTSTVDILPVATPLHTAGHLSDRMFRNIQKPVDQKIKWRVLLISLNFQENIRGRKKLIELVGKYSPRIAYELGKPGFNGQISCVCGPEIKRSSTEEEPCSTNYMSFQAAKSIMPAIPLRRAKSRGTLVTCELLAKKSDVSESSTSAQSEHVETSSSRSLISSSSGIGSASSVDTVDSVFFSERYPVEEDNTTRRSSLAERPHDVDIPNSTPRPLDIPERQILLGLVVLIFLPVGACLMPRDLVFSIAALIVLQIYSYWRQ